MTEMMDAGILGDVVGGSIHKVLHNRIYNGDFMLYERKNAK